MTIGKLLKLSDLLFPWSVKQELKYLPGELLHTGSCAQLPQKVRWERGPERGADAMNMKVLRQSRQTGWNGRKEELFAGGSVGHLFHEQALN